MMDHYNAKYTEYKEEIRNLYDKTFWVACVVKECGLPELVARYNVLKGILIETSIMASDGSAFLSAVLTTHAFFMRELGELIQFDVVSKN